MAESTSRQRKDSSIPLDQCTLPTPEIKISDPVYPFALALRLRVLQIVCGISSLVMGTVALIAEGGEFHLGLGMPAGVVTVIAAGVNIHTSRGFSGYEQPSCVPALRWLGPRPSVALPSTLLWAIACILETALLGLSIGRLLTCPPSSQIFVLAALLLSLAVFTLVAVASLLFIDCRYDPD